MKKVIPFEKLSKKEQKKINDLKRGDWGGINPVSRRTGLKTVYDRNAQKRLDRLYA